MGAAGTGRSGPEVPFTGDQIRLFARARPGAEFALGVAGKSRKTVIAWRRVAADDFAPFDEPGFGKLVPAVSAVPTARRARWPRKARERALAAYTRTDQT
ncbi:hypothetical protein AB0J55_02265 [Amycolatopsis sp. NPDC049688]|uniref:hypothetical protein n=1 Tax=Amycolatopsis sp. NPDC049688 TaxID=3154733 RepID=UPI0034151802